MKLIEQYHSILENPEYASEQIERAARTCYKSEGKIRPGSAEKITKSLRDRGHHAMLEFADLTVRFVTNRGVTHELVRHRLCSFAQESTRYVRYDGNMEFIKPVWWDSVSEASQDMFIHHCQRSEASYQQLLHDGWQPQQAREVLPNALKTEIVVKANLREWHHIFSLRCSKAAHPQIRTLMLGLLEDVKSVLPVVFDDIEL